MGLIISLDQNQSAKGSLYWDDGESQIDHDATRSNYYYAEFNFERNVRDLFYFIFSNFNFTNCL